MSAAAAALPPWALRARLRRWFMQRLPRSDSLLLTQRNVYILPTRAGLMLAFTLFVLLIASINYQLSLGYLLTFLLAGCATASIWVAHSTLRGLRLQMPAPQPLFAGALAALDVLLINERRTPRLALAVAPYGTQNWSWADVPPQGRAQVQLGFKAARRGVHPVPPITVQTLFPMGAFRVWSIWRPAAQLLVWPAPERNPPPLPPGEPVAGSGIAAGARASGEFDGVRAYRHGDPMRLIVWKKFARAGELVSHDAMQMQQRQLWLDFTHAGALDAEARLSRLAAWVLAAEAQGLDYGLRLPGTPDIPPDQGAVQRLRCLQALALWGLPGQSTQDTQ
ncbi:MAG: DUF58 domain-containing protein [Ottowia sp.]|nr:DUF58 domain-containing protein [Ottowia sp.]